MTAAVSGNLRIRLRGFKPLVKGALRGFVSVKLPSGLIMPRRRARDGQSAKTLSVPQAGKLYFGLGRNASYEAARRGDFPAIKIGSRLRVSIVRLEQMLAEAGTSER